MIHLRNGEKLAISIDRKDEAYLCRCLRRSGGAAPVAWFETVDGYLVGLNIAQVNAVFWCSAKPTRPEPPGCDPARLVVHFADRTSITLSRISDDQIEQLREATVARRRAAAFHTLWLRQGDLVSISLATMIYISMPAAWVDHTRLRWSRA